MENIAYTFEETVEELLDGKIVAMSPRPMINHTIVSSNVFTIFHQYLKGKSCRAFADGIDLHLSKKDRFVPDGMVVCNKDFIKPDGVYGAPDLVWEILSPSTAKRDRGYKKNRYEAAGVKEYWIVDTASQSVETYLLQNGSFELTEVYSILPDYLFQKMTEEERESTPYHLPCSLFPDLTISLEEIFDGMMEI